MNRTLKFAMAAAIASMGIAGQAHALTQSTVSTSGSLFLYVFEDRVDGPNPGANPSASNSALFDLGLASAFNTGANSSWNLGSDNAWTSYVATIANPANVHWGVYGVAVGAGSKGTDVLTTVSTAGAWTSGVVGATAIASNALIATYGGAACGTGCGFNQLTVNDAASGAWDDNGGITQPSILTTGLGQSMDFYKHSYTGTKGSQPDTTTHFATGGDFDYFTLGSNGVLTYTAVAAVPEAETYAMMLAGLGLVGFMVRRRKFA